MQKKDCYFLGRITKTRGFKGDLVFFLDVSNAFEYEKLESVLVEFNGLLTPFFVKSIKIQNNNRAFVKLEGVNSEEEAQRLTSKALYLPLTTLPRLSGTEFYDHEIPGFTVYDIVHGNIGKVVQVVDLPNNPLLQIDKNGIEILVPLRNGTVKKINREDKSMSIESPPGLIELYLDEQSRSL
jgi:16S rRNA processing protein RimM